MVPQEYISVNPPRINRNRDKTHVTCFDAQKMQELKDGAIARVFDPIAMDECKRRIGDTVTYCKSMYDAADGADVFALMTEWRQFRMPSWNVIKKFMNGDIVVDCRNIYDCQELEELGLVYTRIGEKLPITSRPTL